MLAALVLIALADSPGFPPALPPVAVEHKGPKPRAVAPKAKAASAPIEPPPPPRVPSPADRWVTFTANPAYEVLGHEDETGTFRYSQSRLKAGAAPARPPAFLRHYNGPANCPPGALQ